jgi:hypothetical protein
VATTSKRRETKKEEPIVTHVEEVKVKEKVEFLSADHLRQLETMDRDVHISKLGMAVEEQAYKNLILENQLLVGKIEKQKIVLMEKAKSYDNMKVMFTNFKRELWPQYGVSEESGLGYDPNTGKIISGN